MTRSLAARERVLLADVGLFADGAAVKIPGEETFRVCQEVVDDMIRVTTDEICAAIVAHSARPPVRFSSTPGAPAPALPGGG